MPTYTRLEAGISTQVGETLFTVTYPTAGSDYPISLPKAFYPHRQAYIEAINTVLTADSLPLTLAEDYPTGAFTLTSSALNFDLEMADPSQVALWMGTTPGATVTNASSITFGDSTAILQVEDPVYEEAYSIKLNRSGNFGDDGRVGAILVNRYVEYQCSIFVTNNEHDSWVTFWPWIAQSRKVVLHRRWDTAASAETNYTLAPLHGSAGFKWLHLDGSTPDDLDSPSQEPFVNGHVFTLTGIIYGV